MAALSTSLGDHMYNSGGSRVSAFPLGAAAAHLYAANVTSLAPLAGKLVRGATIVGEVRRVPPGTSCSIAWMALPAHQAVIGAEQPDGTGRVKIPFTITVPVVPLPLGIYPAAPTALNTGLHVYITMPLSDGIPVLVPPGASVAVLSSALYYSTKPTFNMTLPAEIAVGGSAPATLRAQYWDGERIEGQAVTISAAEGSVALSYNDSPQASEVSALTDANGELRVMLHGVRAAGDAITVLAPAPDLYSPALNAVYPINGSGAAGDCIIVPAAPPVPAVPGYTITSPQFGWDSGARSVDSIAGDAELSFSMGSVVGVVVGLCAESDNVASGDRDAISHGFYMFTDGGRTNQYQVIEYGVRTGPQYDYSADGTFFIRRVGSQVVYSYEVSGEAYSRYTSAHALEGDVIAVSSLYASGDKVD